MTLYLWYAGIVTSPLAWMLILGSAVIAYRRTKRQGLLLQVIGSGILVGTELFHYVTPGHLLAEQLTVDAGVVVFAVGYWLDRPGRSR